jgi:hypothetical protein
VRTIKNNQPNRQHHKEDTSIKGKTQPRKRNTFEKRTISNGKFHRASQEKLIKEVFETKIDNYF